MSASRRSSAYWIWAAPVLALIVLGTAILTGRVALTPQGRASVDDSIRDLQDLSIDAQPPPLYLAEVLLIGHALAQGGDATEDLRRLQELHARHTAAVRRWRDVPALDPLRAELERVTASAEGIFAQYERDLLPMAARGERQRMDELLAGPLATAFTAHRHQVEELLDRVAALRLGLESDARRARRWELAGIASLVAGALAGVILLLGVRAKLQREVAEREARLAGYIRTMPIACIVFGRDGRAEQWNPAAEQLFGWSADEAAARPFWELLLPEAERPKVMNTWQMLVEGPVRNELTNRNLTRDGRELLIAWTNTSIHDRAGAVIGVLSMARDVTALERAREETAHARGLLQAVVDNLPFDIWAMDAGQRITLQNEASRAFWGDCAGRTPEQLGLPAAQHRRWTVELGRVLAGETLVQEMVYERDDGKRVFSAINAPIRVDGRIVGAVGANIDISERRRAEQAVHASEARFRSIFDHAPIGMYRSTPDGRVLQVNDHVARMLGFADPAAMLAHCQRGGSGHGFYPEPQAREDLVARVRSAPGRVVTAEQRMVRLDGTPMDAFLSMCEVADPLTGEATLVGFVQDITERKRAEERRRSTERMLALGQLAGGVAHDFNNLLTSILGYADLLGTRAGEDKSRHYASRIGDAAMQARTLTGRLLSFTRQGAHAPVRYDAHEQVRAAVELFATGRSRHIPMDLRLEAAEYQVRGFPGQLLNAVLNLCINAADAMPSGGRLTVRSDVVEVAPDEATALAPYALRPGPCWRLVVEDTGAGMPPEVLARCLEPLFTTKGDHGTGLGLPSVHGCVNDHHGALRIASRVGVGTTVTIWLPLAGASASGLRPAVSGRDGVARRCGLILVVDDEPHLRDNLADLLRHSGYAVHTLADGAEAVEWVGAHPGQAALALLDMHMPRLDGLAACRALRELDPALPVILTTGSAGGQTLDDLRAQGFAGLLRKPMSARELLEAVTPLVEEQP